MTNKINGNKFATLAFQLFKSCRDEFFCARRARYLQPEVGVSGFERQFKIEKRTAFSFENYHFGNFSEQIVIGRKAKIETVGEFFSLNHRLHNLPQDHLLAFPKFGIV